MSRSRATIVGAVALALALAGPLSPAQAKKTKTFSEQQAVNLPVPDAAAGTTSAPLSATINVPKKFKGRVVGDVNLTGLQTTGSVPGTANDLRGYLTGPTGRTLQLFLLVGDQNLGPWTMDDDTPVTICPTPPPGTCTDPDQSLQPPFAGTANTNLNWGGAFPTNGSLSMFDGTRMRGTWTLTLTDTSTGAGNGINVLNSWGLRIKRAKPVQP